MAKEQTGAAGLAGRYATALFELARETDSLDHVAGDLAQVRAMLDISADLRRVVRSPLVSREQQGAAMAALAWRAGLGETVSGFLGLVARNRRLPALAAMIHAFDALLAQHRGEVTAEVTSARPLTDTQADAVARALARVAGHEVRIHAAVDESLIGGLVVKLGSRMIDASIRTRLLALRAAMKGAA